MKRRECRNQIARLATLSIAVVALSCFAFSSYAETQKPPLKTCSAVDKREYDSAKKQKLLRGRFGYYVRTGRVFRRYYWFCRS